MTNNGLILGPCQVWHWFVTKIHGYALHVLLICISEECLSTWLSSSLLYVLKLDTPELIKPLAVIGSSAGCVEVHASNSQILLLVWVVWVVIVILKVVLNIFKEHSSYSEHKYRIDMKLYIDEYNPSTKLINEGGILIETNGSIDGY